MATRTNQKTGGSANRFDNVRLEIAYVAIDHVRTDAPNLRKRSKRTQAQLENSLRAFGFVMPVLVDAQHRVIVGQARVAAAKAIGLAEIPTIRTDHLSDEEARAFRIADNRLAEVAEWNDKLLAQELQALSALDLDFSLEVTGFDLPEIEFRINSLDTDLAAENEADEVPEPMARAVSKVGDLWHLGPHRLLCADALDRTSYELLLAGETAAVVFTDPPYNVPIAGHVSGKGAVRHREFVQGTGEMSPEAFDRFLRDVTGLLAAFSQSGSVQFICMDWRHIDAVLIAGRAAYSDLLNICVWVKRNGGMGSLYRSQHELVAVFRNAGAAHRNNVQLGRFGRNRTNVWDYAGANSFASGAETRELLALHPTVKPVKLVADAILDVTKRGDIVLDPFLGSGTTLIAAERTGRRGFGLELDPLYADTIVRRWQGLTGERAHNAQGDAFDHRASREGHHEG